jgi:hypothetical protein
VKKLILITVFLFFISCKEQEKNKHDKNYTIEDTESHLNINKDKIDKNYIDEEGYFKSKLLNKIFKKDYNYFQENFEGCLNFGDYHYEAYGVFKSNKYLKTYYLLFDNKNNLRDTISSPNKDISFDITFKNKTKGIAIGKMNIENLNNPYFHIAQLYKLDVNTLRINKIEINTQIEFCDIPSSYCSEEFASMADYFQYGIKDQPIINKTYPSNLKGLWGVVCQNELTELDIDKSEGFLSLYSPNAIYIKLKIEKSSNQNEYLLWFQSTSSQQDYYGDRLKIENDDDISRDKVIGKLIVEKDGKATLHWIGLYNIKKQKLEFVGDDFLFIKENGGNHPVLLEKCD